MKRDTALQLFDNTVSRIQYSSWSMGAIQASDPAISRRKSVPQFWEAKSPDFKRCPSVCVALTQVTSWWQVEITPGQFSVLGAVHLYLVYFPTHSSLGWGERWCRAVISCGRGEFSLHLCCCIVLGTFPFSRTICMAGNASCSCELLFTQ